MRTYIFILFTASAISFLSTRWIAQLAAACAWARRRGDSSGEQGVPRLGGVAVFAAILLSLGAAVLLRNMVTELLIAVGVPGIALVVACFAVFLVGLFDDLKGARPWQKLAVQTVAALGLYAFGFRIDVLTNPFTRTTLELGWLALPLTVFWLVAISNAFNLIDGLDGLAAGVGMFAGVSLFLLAAMRSNVFVAAVAAAIAGSLVGFLPHNFHPAKIYLGDSGSLTAGLALGALSIVSEQKGPVMVTMAIPILIFGLPLLEVAVTTVRRLLSGHPLFGRDEDHLHHRLLKVGIAKRLAVFVLYSIAAMFALSSILLVNYSGSVAPLIAVVCGALAWIVVGQMRYPEFTELDAHIRLALSSQPAMLRNQIAIRRASAEFAAAASAQEVWASLCTVLELLGFAEARCELRAPDGQLRQALDWNLLPSGETSGGTAPAPGEHIECRWALEIPLFAPVGSSGVVRIGHAFDQRAPMFRMESLIELISESFGRAVTERLYEPRVAEAEVAPPPLATATLKAVAGARR